MVRHELFEVNISSPDGDPLTEYDDPDEEKEVAKIAGPVVIKYVEAVAGEAFVIDFKFYPGVVIQANDTISFDTFADGDLLDGTFAIPERVKDDGSSSHCVDTREFRDEAGNWQKQKFRFGVLNAVEHDLDQPNCSSLDEMGTIKIVIKHVHVYGESSVYGVSDVAARGMALDVPETALKGRTADLRFGFEAPTQTNARKICRIGFVGDLPLVTMIFKYRSRDALQREGIIERSPSPVPLLQRDPAELNNNELRERLAQVEAKEAARAQHIKKEQVENNNLKRKQPSADNGSARKIKAAADPVYVAGSIAKVCREIGRFGKESHGTPRKLEKQRAALLRDMEALRTELLGDDSEESEDEESDVTVVEDDHRAKSARKDVLEISDDDE